MAQALLRGATFRLGRAPSTGSAPVFPPELIVQVKALGCELPATHGVSLSRWSLVGLTHQVCRSVRIPAAFGQDSDFIGIRTQGRPDLLNRKSSSSSARLAAAGSSSSFESRMRSKPRRNASIGSTSASRIMDRMLAKAAYRTK